MSDTEKRRDPGNESNRGLASADPETRARVARAGGFAPHRERGLQAASPETRERVARMGGVASHGGQPRSAVPSGSFQAAGPAPNGPGIGPLEREQRGIRNRKRFTRT